MKIEGVKGTVSLDEEQSEFLKQNVVPFCEYMKGEIPPGSKNGLLVIATDGESFGGQDHTLFHVCGDDEHIAQALAVIMLSDHGEILRKASRYAAMLMLKKKL